MENRELALSANTAIGIMPDGRIHKEISGCAVTVSFRTGAARGETLKEVMALLSDSFANNPEHKNPKSHICIGGLRDID